MLAESSALRSSCRIWPSSRPLRWALILAVGVFLLLCVQQLTQLYVIDEAEFPYIADATAHSGVPIYYHGELRPQDVGIFHPPFYVYSLAAWTQLFGASHAAVRSFGVACALLTAGIGMTIARLLSRPAHRDAIGVGFAALYLLNPLVIASALLPDIDGTVGVLAVTFGLLVIVAVMTTPVAGWQVWGAGGALGLALSTKLTTPLALVPAMFVAFFLSGRNVRMAARDFVAAAVLGVAAFLTWWGLLSASTSLTFTFPFRFTYDSLISKSGHMTMADRLLAIPPGRLTLFWLDPLLLLLTAGGILWAAFHLTDRCARALGLVGGFALATTALYDVITTPVFRFPKYWIAAVPAATIVAVVLVGVLLPQAAPAWRWRPAPAALAAGGLVVLLCSDVAYQRAAAAAADHIVLRRPLSTALTVIAFLGLLALALRPGQQSRRRAAPYLASFVTTSIILTVGAHGLAQAFAQRSAPYSTRYYYGERGFGQAIADVRALTPNREPILAAKDVGFESGRPFYEDALLFPDPAQLQSVLQEGKVKLAVTRKDYDYSEPVYPAAFALLRKYMTPVFDRPDSGFVIWRPISPPQVGP
ncbi:MAG: hypothetical protein NVS3B26_17730 [Mycobacteriales bacterium]